MKILLAVESCKKDTKIVINMYIAIGWKCYSLQNKGADVTYEHIPKQKIEVRKNIMNTESLFTKSTNICIYDLLNRKITLINCMGFSIF